MVTLSRLIGIGAGFFFGIVLHEYAHAKVSDMLGDRYPRLQGRLTLNPKAHVDPVGTLGMPGLFLFLSLVGQPFRFVFGYGKPMEYNPQTLRNGTAGRVMVALAGPAVNLALAAIGGIGSRIVPAGGSPSLAAILLFFMSVNVFLLVINVLPIPPLDGSKILALFLSPAAQFKMQEYSQYILLFLIVIFLFLPAVPAAMATPICRALSGIPFLTGCPL